MKILKVPLYLQDPGSVDCGPVCSRMMLEFYGIKRTLEELRELVRYSEAGTSSFDNGSIFLAEGFSVQAVTAHPLLFPPDLQDKLRDKAKLLERINGLVGRLPDKADNLATLRKYLDLGGEVCMEIPAFRHVKDAIDNGNPVLALMYAKALGNNEGGHHFVVVNGYKRGFVHILNPSPRATNRGWFPVERFLYAVHCHTLVDIDNGTLIVPKR
jgi:hypothetical protein